MKIVHLIEYFSPVLGYQETYLAREQQKMGHEVVVVTSDRYFPFPNYETTVGSILGARIVGAIRRKEEGITVIRKSIAFEIFTRVWIKDLIPSLKALNPDVIHVHSVSSLSTIRLALSRDFKDIVVLADDHSHLSVVAGSMVKNLFYGLFKLLFGSIISRNIDQFVAITSETKSIMQDYMGITAPIKIIELGADTNLFKPEPSKGKLLRQKMGFSDRDVVFIYTGKLVVDKGIDTLIRAFLSLPKYHKLLLVGSGPTEYLSPLRILLENSGRQNDVFWVPTVKPQQLPQYYSCADVGVWPKQESISMLEAAACGLPVIVKKSASMRRRIRNGNGISYQEGNVSQLVSVMKTLGESRRTRKLMGAKGREHIRSAYSWEALAKQFVLLYRKKRDI